MLPKRGTLISIEVEGYSFKINGSNFMVKSSERTSRPVKKFLASVRWRSLSWPRVDGELTTLTRRSSVSLLLSRLFTWRFALGDNSIEGRQIEQSDDAQDAHKEQLWSKFDLVTQCYVTNPILRLLRFLLLSDSPAVKSEEWTSRASFRTLSLTTSNRRDRCNSDGRLSAFKII